MTIYREDIYSGRLNEAVPGSVIVKIPECICDVDADEMPVLILVWWRCPGKGIVAMSHQSLQ
jgi:hypothetical protein